MLKRRLQALKIADRILKMSLWSMKRRIWSPKSRLGKLKNEGLGLKRSLWA